ncbi:hypothetical protein PN36_33820 [Candidatus Thiomargarita nelsonii]|uniref:Uncharacterized protein n=1 Tax=Candidatus Thiomargarita nelsonii TaxID=1003181 RepID=A0A4E0QIY2_9GAMM|nr:hypothetical protein PN36_33820 [Candidatus Thiomargarita nelsonii]
MYLIDDGEYRIVTTEPEREGHNIIRALLKEIIDPERVVMRDTVSYCGILLDSTEPIKKTLYYR